MSPEIGSNRTVTFRIYAPKATEVLVTGDWMTGTDKPIPMSKQYDGVWIGTAGPLEPNAYSYSFKRSYYVYTPPGYQNKRGTDLPVLVLLPGTPGTEADWVSTGKVNRILDNLIAQRKVAPLLVLMSRADVLLKSGTRTDNLREFEPGSEDPKHVP